MPFGAAFVGAVQSIEAHDNRFFTVKESARLRVRGHEWCLQRIPPLPASRVHCHGAHVSRSPGLEIVDGLDRRIELESERVHSLLFASTWVIPARSLRKKAKL